VNPSTRRMRAVDLDDRWLYRRDGNDYGPVTTDALFEAMVARKVDLSTEVFSLRAKRWQPASDHAILRDFFDKCASRWKAEAAERDVQREVRKLTRARRARHGFWRLMLVGLFIVVGFGAWVVWRLGHAEPVGFERVVRLAHLTALPAPVFPEGAHTRVPDVPATAVARLSEPETYDTAGVAFEGEDARAATVTRLEFTADGQALGISAAELNRVIESARGGLNACATDAAMKDRRFTGTDVGFTVHPGRIAGITVGAEVRANRAFQACVKTALGRVPVPTYSGGERRVTIPLKVAW